MTQENSSNGNLQAALVRLNQGDSLALETLLQLSYNSHFLPLAERVLRNDRFKHEVPTADLVHHTYYKMRSVKRTFPNLEAFFRCVTAQMKNVLVDMARRNSSKCRGGEYEVLGTEAWSTFLED